MNEEVNLHKKDRLRYGGLIIGTLIGLAIFVLRVFSSQHTFLSETSAEASIGSLQISLLEPRTIYAPHCCKA